MKWYQLIATVVLLPVIITSCSGNANRSNDLDNHPALDTVKIPDTINNFRLPVTDSTLKSTDTVALR